MLGKNDLNKELGNGICIYPFHENNLKENSYNLTIGQNAWSQGSARVIKRGNGKYVKATAGEKNAQVKTISRGQSAIIEDGKSKYLILLPHATTIVETSEVVGVDYRIGGTIHSKVGTVAQGVGDTSTMLGPCFCGHLMISLHNVTDEIITLPVGDTFVSLIFYHLETPNADIKNSNMSGHVDKLSELGIQINRQTREYLLADWKQNIEGIRDNMIKSESYIEYRKKEKDKKNADIKRYFTMKNILLALTIVVLVIAMGWLAYKLDMNSNDPKWVDRYWMLLCAGFLIPILNCTGKLFDK